MENDVQVELAAIFQRWLEANPMHTTLFGKTINLHGSRNGIPAFSQWLAQSVVDAVEWNDQNPSI